MFRENPYLLCVPVGDDAFTHSGKFKRFGKKYGIILQKI